MQDKGRPGPLTLAEAEEWLHTLEDDLRMEQAVGFAARFILGNLFTHLSNLGVIDGAAYLRHLQTALPAVEDTGERAALRLLLDDLLAQAARPAHGADVGGGRH